MKRDGIASSAVRAGIWKIAVVADGPIAIVARAQCNRNCSPTIESTYTRVRGHGKKLRLEILDSRFFQRAYILHGNSPFR